MYSPGAFGQISSMSLYADWMYHPATVFDILSLHDQSLSTLVELRPTVGLVWIGTWDSRMDAVCDFMNRHDLVRFENMLIGASG